MHTEGTPQRKSSGKNLLCFICVVLCHGGKKRTLLALPESGEGGFASNLVNTCMGSGQTSCTSAMVPCTSSSLKAQFYPRSSRSAVIGDPRHFSLAILECFDSCSWPSPMGRKLAQTRKSTADVSSMLDCARAFSNSYQAVRDSVIFRSTRRVASRS